MDEDSEERSQNSEVRIQNFKDQRLWKHEYAEYQNISGFSRRARAAGAAHGVGAQFLVGLAAGCGGTFSPARSEVVGCGSSQSREAAGEHRAGQIAVGLAG